LMDGELKHCLKLEEPSSSKPPLPPSPLIP
jgi:hypothetical protein